MMAVELSCDTASRLVGSWRAGALATAERDAYEQHLLVCPPCLRQNDKASLASAALSKAADETPPDDLLVRLTEQVIASSRQGR